ncbi:hypothetical protein PInf_008442 [Phytophthora infestans]|nr:hypothetical protein PInf_008442 [Phytophthora infestans]
MNPDVVFNSEYGPDPIMQHWCFMDWFGDVNVELEGWEMLEGMALVALTTTRVTVTANTRRNVFPHLRTIDNSDRNGRQKRGPNDASEESAYDDVDEDDAVVVESNTSAHQPPSSPRALQSKSTG